MLPAGTKCIFNGHPCVATDYSFCEPMIFEFDINSNFNGIRCLDLSKDKQYYFKPSKNKKYYFIESNRVVVCSNQDTQDVKNPGYNCHVCNDFNKWAEPNMTEDRHLCFSCRASYSWKFEKEML